MRKGCGRGRNEFAGRVQNHHVRFSFHRNGHNIISFFLEIIKLLQVWILCVAGYAKDAIVGACHRTIDGQEQRFGMLDQNETRFFTYLSQRAESKAATVATSD